MKKSEMKELMKEAIMEALGDSFIPSLIEIVIKSTEKTIDKKLTEALQTKPIVRKKKKKQPARAITERTESKVVKKKKPVVLSKNPIMNKMLQETLLSTKPSELAEYGSGATDMSNFNQNYQTQELMQDEYAFDETTAPLGALSENLTQDSLQGSVMDNAALADVFKKDYRSTLKALKGNGQGAKPEAVQFFKAD